MILSGSLSLTLFLSHSLPLSLSSSHFFFALPLPIFSRFFERGNGESSFVSRTSWNEPHLNWQREEKRKRNESEERMREKEGRKRKKIERGELLEGGSWEEREEQLDTKQIVFSSSFERKSEIMIQENSS